MINLISRESLGDYPKHELRKIIELKSNGIPFIKFTNDSLTEVNGCTQVTCPLLPEVKPTFIHYSKVHNLGQFWQRIDKAIKNRIKDSIEFPYEWIID